MKHDNTDEITCPWCDHVLRDSWEYDDGGEVQCTSCEKTMLVDVHHSITYSTKRPACEDDVHTPGEGRAIHIRQADLDRWLAEGGALANMAKDRGLHTLWLRDCTTCGEREYKTVELDAPNPWDQP